MLTLPPCVQLTMTAGRWESVVRELLTEIAVTYPQVHTTVASVRHAYTSLTHALPPSASMGGSLEGTQSP